MVPGCYEIVPYVPELKPQLLQLQTHLWSRDVRLNDAHFRWKYEENPYFREPIVHLALCDGQVVGMRGMCGARWQVGVTPETFVAPYADDLVVAPEHRNRGLFTQIMRAALDAVAGRGLDYVFNLSAGRTTQLGSLSMGWKSAGGVAPLGRRRPASLLRRYLSMPATLARARIRGAFSRLDRMAERSAKSSVDATSVTRHPRPEAMADLIARLPLDGRFRHVRDAAYFGWRFRNPFRDYRFLYVGESRLDGYMVLQCQPNGQAGSARVNIVDWEATDATIREALLDAALQGAFAELVIWSASIDAESRDLLRRRAFGPIDEADAARGVPGILIRPVRDDALRGEWTIHGHRLLDLANWDMTMLYSMHG